MNIKGINDYLAEGGVAIIPGFQGISKDNRITTLGRGGSDTSAVALAAAFSAERCDIFTDVDGVLTDGGIYFSSMGESLKKFNVRDGMGVELLHDNHIKVILLTRENSDIVKLF